MTKESTDTNEYFNFESTPFKEEPYRRTELIRSVILVIVRTSWFPDKVDWLLTTSSPCQLHNLCQICCTYHNKDDVQRKWKTWKCLGRTYHPPLIDKALEAGPEFSHRPISRAIPLCTHLFKRPRRENEWAQESCGIRCRWPLALDNVAKCSKDLAAGEIRPFWDMLSLG